jgi:multimeric flavodoxin WrbA
MKITILQGSPNKNGSTAMLAEAFAKGAGEAGHETSIINVAHENIHPCTGCVSCGYEGTCVQKDGMESIRRELLQSDMIVFATPLYYFGMTAQLKIVVDRFCAFNSSLNRRHLKSVLLAVAWNSSDWTFDSLESHYKTLVRYLNLDDQGEILGYGCGTPSMTKNSGFVEKAYQLGASLR